MVVNSFILFMDFKDKILVSIFFLFPHIMMCVGNACTTCIFLLQIGKTTYQSSVSLSPYHIVGKSDGV